MAIDYTWLETNVLMRTLGKEERSKLDHLLVEKHFAKTEKILTQGQVGGALYILRSGMAEITAECNAQQMQIATAKEGELFGEITFLTGDAATATVIAVEDCTVYQLKRADCSELMQSEPELVYAFMAYMLLHAGNIIRSRNADHANMLQYMSSSHK